MSDHHINDSGDDPDMYVLHKPTRIYKTWTPEPEPYDPEKYVVWGRKHYGEEWYRKRQDLLHTNGVCLGDFQQTELRNMEREIEGRPLESDLNYELLLPKSPTPPFTSTQSNHGDEEEQSVVSGYSTYPNSEIVREITPPPDDKWDRLEWEREHSNYTDMEYRMQRYFRADLIIDLARSKREMDERQAMEKRRIAQLKYLQRNNPGLYHQVKTERDLLLQGWTWEQIQDCYQSEEETFNRYQGNPQRNTNLMFAPPQNGGESSTLRRRSSRLALNRRANRREGIGNTVRRQTQPHSKKKNSRKTQSGRIHKQRRLAEKKPRKLYQKERTSRRLAALSPEYGMLPNKGETPQRLDDSKRPVRARGTANPARQKNQKTLHSASKIAKPQKNSRKKSAIQDSIEKSKNKRHKGPDFSESSYSALIS